MFGLSARHFYAATLVVVCFVFGSCSHAKKGLNQKQLRSRVVALAEINGAKEARLQTEIAIVNDIIEKGRFQILDRATVQSALVQHPTSADWQALGKELGADLILSVDILEFQLDSRNGYDAIEEEDSLLSAEHRSSRDQKWKHYYKVKSQTGLVKVRVRFFDVSSGSFSLSQENEASRTYNSRDGDMPRAMKILEELTQQAVTTAFDSLPQ